MAQTLSEWIFTQIEILANLNCFLEPSNEASLATKLLNASIVWTVIFIVMSSFAPRLYHLLKYYVYAQYFTKEEDFKRKFGHTWVVITGGSDGIGLGVSKLLAKLNMKLIVIARNLEKLESVKQQLISLGSPEVDIIQADLSNVEEEETIRRIEAELKLDQRQIGVLINNAGTTTSLRKFYKHSFSTIKRVINVNSLSPVFMSHLIAQHMNKHKLGLIASTSSGTVDYVVPFMGAYIPSKTFLNHFTQMLSKEYPNLSMAAFQTGFTRTKLLSGDLNNDWAVRLLMLTSVEAYVKSALNILYYTSTRECGYLFTAGHLKHQIYTGGVFLLDAFSVKSLSIAWVLRIRQNIKYRYSVDVTTNKDQ